ncbi:hypothetical protein BGZ65_007722, partial [Modicella reniformis]
MQSAHPLEIPEIVSYVASYVRKRNLTTCALVSKTWYQAFNPFIWHDINCEFEGPYLPEALHRHTQLVRTLKADYSSGKEGRKKLLDLRFPNLVSLDLSIILLHEDMKEWVLDHSSVTHLNLNASDLNPVFWSTLFGFRHLKNLTVWRLELSGKDVDTFWQLCTHLERLEVFFPKISYPGNTLSMEFLSIKEFKLCYFNHKVEDFIPKFLQRCPSLTSFWVYGKDSPEFISSISELVAARTWPHLHSITIMACKIASDTRSKIIR